MATQHSRQSPSKKEKETGLSRFAKGTVMKLTRGSVANITSNKQDKSKTLSSSTRQISGIKTALKKSDAEPILKDVSSDPEFASLKGDKLRVVPAEAWAVLLSKVCSTEKKAPSLYATLSDDVHTQYVDVASQAKKVAKPGLWESISANGPLVLRLDCQSKPVHFISVVARFPDCESHSKRCNKTTRQKD